MARSHGSAGFPIARLTPHEESAPLSWVWLKACFAFCSDLRLRHRKGGGMAVGTQRNREASYNLGRP